METKTKRRAATEGPKAAEPAIVEPEVVQNVEAPTKKKRPAIKRKEQNIAHTEFEVPKGGGIVLMLPQKGVTVYDKVNDTVREIRYCPNEPSIYVDEQSSNALKQSVSFREGRLFVPKTKPNLRKFLEIHPMNMVNGGELFREVNKKREAEAELQQEFLLVDAIGIVRDRDITDLLPIALYFGVNINTPSSEIRFNLLRIAKAKTEEFLSALDSPQVMCRSTILQAKDFQIINLKPDGVYWFDSNKLIISVPAGVDAIDAMVRFCLTEKGASTLALIEERLEKIG